MTTKGRLTAFGPSPDSKFGESGVSKRRDSHPFGLASRLANLLQAQNGVSGVLDSHHMAYTASVVLV